MACNSCSKSFTLFRSEKGCPNCGFSYCSKCLNNKVFLKKLNSDVKVCFKCKQLTNSNKPQIVEAPDAYYKRIAAVTDNTVGENESASGNSADKEISDRLKKLKENKMDRMTNVSSQNIEDRLQKLKGEIPSTSDAELRSRLANIKGVPTSAVQSEQQLPKTTVYRTEQEQVEHLMRQYFEQGNIDKKYVEDFDGVISNIEARLQKLKGSQSSELNITNNYKNNNSDDEDETIRKIIEKAKTEAKMENEEIDTGTEELPFCEICNEDAVMRCLGCKYLFCKQCFKDHEDSDDGCDKFVEYSPPKNFEM